MSQIDQETRATERAPRRSPKRRPVLLATALAAATAVAAGAVAVGSGGGKAGPPAPSGAPTPALDGTRVLLAAATTAANRPDGSGAYWHVRATDKTEVRGKSFTQSYETWLDKSGTYWRGVAKKPGTSGALNHWRQGGYAFSDEDVVSVARLRALPTQPKALAAWAAALNKIRSGDASPDDPTVRNDFSAYTAVVLIDLLAEAPAPPKVRSAAYRALATMDRVRFLGPAKDPRGRTGQAFRIAGSSYIVDTRTSLVLSVTTAPVNKQTAKTRTKTKVLVDVGWTDTRPHVPAS
ncbi:hypothetical protein ACTIVE_6271 [Actinomadura verrucosospora]|uniref:CU044_5270 family protein n=2 Tax=Actinomadura verrucosospora TaxID=46165 RepID=A0A7D3ZR95_ACTVE|nr:hypothetical protein ACTIVE_6271 [Actinomadura verrucosospora]